MKQERALRRIHQIQSNQRETIDQFFTTQKATITDLYRIDQDTERTKTSIERIEQLLNQKRAQQPQSASHATIMSELTIETGILKAIISDSQKQFDRVHKSTGLQHRISKNLLAGRKEILKLLNYF